MRAAAIAFVVGVAGAAGAAPAGDLCAPAVVHRGALIDLDLVRADVRAALRFVADTAHVNLVVAGNVAGTVSLHLERVPWDAAACAIATLVHLELRYDDAILLVRKR